MGSNLSLETNPKLRETTSVNTFRGRHILFRIDGDYPGAVCPLTADGKAIGEFRGGICLSTIVGHHPKGTPTEPVTYCPSDAPIITIRYNELILPVGVTMNGSSRAASKERKSVRLTRLKVIRDRSTSIRYGKRSKPMSRRCARSCFLMVVSSAHNFESPTRKETHRETKAA